VIVTADQAFCFLFAWEALTVAFYLFTGYDRQRADRTSAAVITVMLGKISGALLLIGFLLLAGRAGDFTFAGMEKLPQSGLRDAAYALLIAGFAVKVGLIPVHVWMPRGYRAAPGPARAIMAGVAVNVGFYGMWRTLDVLHRPPGWLAVVVLLLAAATALLGIAHSTVQTDLTEVIAYSSVENGGLITVGYAVAMIGAVLQMAPLIAVGLIAGMLQMVAHAVAKSLLFSAIARVEDVEATMLLDDLRGIGHRFPWSGTGIAFGAATLAGLPLTVGFVSEWFLLESLMQQFRVGHLTYALPMAVAGALVALTAGFAAVAFVRVVGLVVLGPRGARESEEAENTGPLLTRLTGRAGLVLLTVACLGIAALTPLELRIFGAGLSVIVPGTVLAGSEKGPWVLQPVYQEFSIVSPSWLAVAMPMLFVAVVGFCLLVARRRMFAVRRVPAWRSATSGVEGDAQYTPFAFANPTRKVLATVLMTRSELRTVEVESGGQIDERQRDAAGAHLGYTSDVVELVERLLYQPLLRPFLAVARAAQRMQNGRLDAYIAYMLIAFVAVLAVIMAVG
ncbi:MAG: proton-conducting transporter membrane subunit, partial [Sciscionella sp.]